MVDFSLSPDTGYILGALGLARLGWVAWNGKSRKRGKKLADTELPKRREELKDTYTLRPMSEADKWRREKAKGEVAYAFLGSYPANLSLPLLRSFIAVGCENHVGEILYGEFERQRRDEILAAIPSYFKEKVTAADCPNLPGGFHGAPAEKVAEKEHLWGADLREAVREWRRRIERNDEPELLMVYVSPGSHQALLMTVVRMYKERYPGNPVYVITALDHKDMVRARFPAWREKVMRSGLVNGIFITDNRRNSQVNDTGVTLMPSALSAGGWLGKLPLQMGNTLGLMFDPEGTVRYATIAVWAETLAVKHLEAVEDGLAETDEDAELLKERYYTKTSLVEEKTARAIKTLIGNHEYQAVSLPGAPEGNLRSILVVAPLMPTPDYARFASRVLDNINEWKAKTDRNLEINFASFGVDFTPEITETYIAVILLQPLADDGSGLDTLALNGSPKLLPAPAADEEIEVTAPTTTATRGRGRPPKGQTNE